MALQSIEITGEISEESSLSDRTERLLQSMKELSLLYRELRTLRLDHIAFALERSRDLHVEELQMSETRLPGVEIVPLPGDER